MFYRSISLGLVLFNICLIIDHPIAVQVQFPSLYVISLPIALLTSAAQNQKSKVYSNIVWGASRSHQASSECPQYIQSFAVGIRLDHRWMPPTTSITDFWSCLLPVGTKRLPTSAKLDSVGLVKFTRWSPVYVPTNLSGMLQTTRSSGMIRSCWPLYSYVNP